MEKSYAEIVSKDGNKFYEVKEEVIDQVQEELGIILPLELKKFYHEIGYGFLKSENYLFNRIMDPIGIRDFRLRKGEFENNDELEIYAELEKDKIIFFEVSEGYFLSIGFAGESKGKIFDDSNKIADSLDEFLIKYQENENYFD